MKGIYLERQKSKSKILVSVSTPKQPRLMKLQKVFESRLAVEV